MNHVTLTISQKGKNKSFSINLATRQSAQLLEDFIASPLNKKFENHQLIVHLFSSIHHDQTTPIDIQIIQAHTIATYLHNTYDNSFKHKHINQEELYLIKVYLCCFIEGMIMKPAHTKASIKNILPNFNKLNKISRQWMGLKDSLDTSIIDSQPIERLQYIGLAAFKAKTLDKKTKSALALTKAATMIQNRTKIQLSTLKHTEASSFIQENTKRKLAEQTNRHTI